MHATHESRLEEAEKTIRFLREKVIELNVKVNELTQASILVMEDKVKNIDRFNKIYDHLDRIMDRIEKLEQK